MSFIRQLLYLSIRLFYHWICAPIMSAIDDYKHRNDLPRPPVPCQICGKLGHKERYCPNAKGLPKRILDSAFHAGTWLFLEDPYSVSYGNMPLFLYNELTVFTMNDPIRMLFCNRTASLALIRRVASTLGRFPHSLHNILI
jgi:hypothetical protein